MNMNITNKTKEITTKDKVWIALNLMPRRLVEAFAMDCASRATSYSPSYAVFASSAALSTQTRKSKELACMAAYYVATSTADAALASLSKSSYVDMTNAVANEYELQLKSIAKLIKGNKGSK